MQVIRFVLIMVLFLGTSLAIRAQVFNGGVKAGVAASQISGDRLAGFDKAGPIAGAWVNYYFSKYDALQLEIFYNQKGSRKNATQTNPSVYVLRLHYVDVPVIYHRKFKDNFAFEIGPSFAVLADHLEKDENGEASFTGAPEFKPYEIAFNLGFDVLLIKNLTLNIRLLNSAFAVRDYDGRDALRLNHGQYNTAIFNSLHLKF